MAGRTGLPRRRRPAWRRAARYFGMVVLFAGVALVAAVLDEVATVTLSGVPRVVDGDTLAFGRRRVRLAGIDAPELGQTCRRGGSDYACGRDAHRFLADLAGQGRVECSGSEEDRYGRLLVHCISVKTDINSQMVRAGWAVSYGGYEYEERVARNEGAGMWAGSFDRPSEWRARHGAVADLGPANLVRRLINRIARLSGVRTGKAKE